MKKLLSIDRTSQSVDVALLITRVAIALLMLTHGVPKLGKFSQDPIQFMNFFGLGEPVSLSLAVFAEVLCSVFLLLGLGTRFAVIPLSITMVVALLHVHIEDPFSKQELAWHYLLVYAVLFIFGSGKYSLDHLLFKRERNLVSKNVVSAAR